MPKKEAVNYSQDFGAPFQDHILAVMCRVPGFCIRYRTALDHTFFVSDANRIIARALLAHIDEERRLPTHPTLIEDIRPLVGKDDFAPVESALGELYGHDVQDAHAVMQKAVAFGKQQALVNAIVEAAGRLDKGNRDVRPLIDDALLVGEDLLEIGIDYRADIDDRAVWYTDPQKVFTGVRTGIEHLDAVLAGGLGRGELGVILAPPKRGKSTTLINIGFGALSDVSGLNVAHYSLEMNDQKVTQRYDDRLMGLRVKYKRSDPIRYVQELKARATKLLPGRLFVKSYPTRSATISTVRSHLALLASREFYPDVIIVDYADIMKPERRLGEMRHEQAGIYEDLRAIAGEFDAAVWTGSQAKQAALQKEVITIEDFAEAFEKAAIVDAAFAFCQTDDERIDGRARLFAAGLRDVEDGRTIECDIRRDCCLISSTGVLDVAGTRIGGDIEAHAMKVDAVKESVGLTRKKKVTKKGKKKVKKKKLTRPKKELDFEG